VLHSVIRSKHAGKPGIELQMYGKKLKVEGVLLVINNKVSKVNK
jgi:hypothetical protein